MNYDSQQAQIQRDTLVENLALAGWGERRGDDFMNGQPICWSDIYELIEAKELEAKHNERGTTTAQGANEGARSRAG